jgi:hypothetical protein
MRKVFGVILVTLLLIMAVTGCSSKDNKEVVTDKAIEGGLAKGRYVEEDIVFPEGIKSNEIVSITASPSGDIELYTYNNGSYKAYLINKKWRKVEVEALQKFNDFTSNDFKISKVFYGEDKRQYLIGETISDYHSVLYRLSDAGVFEKVEL